MERLGYPAERLPAVAPLPRVPDYGGRCFDGLPATIERLLNGRPGELQLGAPVLEQTYDRVVLVYLDAFGWSSSSGTPTIHCSRAPRWSSA